MSQSFYLNHIREQRKDMKALLNSSHCEPEMRAHLENAIQEHKELEEVVEKQLKEDYETQFEVVS